MNRATVISDGEHEVHASRTNTYIGWRMIQMMLSEVSKRFSILVQMPINNAEQFQLVHYGPELNKPHFDSFDKNTEEEEKIGFLEDND